MTPGNTAPAVLITMPHSHYSEKARWALDAVPAAMRKEALRLRDTGTGRFALRLFLQERGCSSVPPRP